MADRQIEVTLRLSGIQQFRTQLGTISSAAKNLGRDFQAFGSSLANSARNIARITAAVAGAGAAIGALTIRNANLNDEIAKGAEVTGVSTDRLQELAFASDQIGVSREQLIGGLQRFSTAVGQLRTGTGTLTTALKDTNPQLLQQLQNTKSVEEAFNLYINAARTAGDENQRNFLISTAFGRANLRLGNLARISAGELDNMAQAARNVGAVVSSSTIQNSVILNDTLAELQQGISGISRELTGALQPAFIRVSRSIINFVSANRKEIVNLANDGVERLTETVNDLIVLFKSGGEAQNISETARVIYDRFVLISNSVSSATFAMRRLFSVFDDFIKLITFGSASGQDVIILAILLRVTGLLGVLTSGFALVTSAAKLFFAAVGLIGPALTLLSGPLGLVVLGISALAAGIIYLATQTDFFETSIRSISNFFKDLSEIAPFVLEEIANTFEDISIAISGFFEDAMSFFADLISETESLLEETFKSIIKFFESVVDSAKDILISIVDGTLIREIVSKIGSIFEEMRNNLTQFVSDVSGNITSVFSDIISFIRNSINSFIAGISNSIRSVFSSITGSITDVLDGIGRRISSFVSSIARLVSQARNLFSSSNQRQPTAQGFATGGFVSGSGTATSDSIFARLSNGEFVISANSVKKFGVGFFNSLNNGIIPQLKGFANGGLVDALSIPTPNFNISPSFAPALIQTGQSSGRALNLVLPNGKTIKTRGVEESVAKELEKELRGSANARATNLPSWY